MAEPDIEEEDLFADLYDADDSAPSKDQTGVPSQPAAAEPPKASAPVGYGEEPDVGHDPTSFDTDPITFDAAFSQSEAQEQNGGDVHMSTMASEQGIQMKEDG